MEFKFDIKNVATEEVMKIDNTLTAIGHEKNENLKNRLKIIIDEMGKASAIAQGLHMPKTSSESLANSDHILYLMTEHDKPDYRNFNVFAILKIGMKKLYLYNKERLRSSATVYCILDFYVHESKQRKGYGVRLMECMLQDINLEAKHLAIDKPTLKQLQFMSKHFQLSKIINQDDNFIVYEEFFEHASDEKNHDNSGHRAVAYKRSPGRHGAHKHHDTMGEIVQGKGNSVKFK